MKKYLVGIAVVAVAALIAVSGVNAQQAGVDKIETLSTNYVAQVRTNAALAATAVVPALTAGQGLYTYIKITPATNAYIAFGRTPTTSDPQITTAGWSWSLPAASVDNGGPYRNTAIHLLNTSGDATTNLVTVEAWKVIKQR
jgi:Tfp pilus assembly protein PilV